MDTNDPPSDTLVFNDESYGFIDRFEFSFGCSWYLAFYRGFYIVIDTLKNEE